MNVKIPKVLSESEGDIEFFIGLMMFKLRINVKKDSTHPNIFEFFSDLVCEVNELYDSFRDGNQEEAVMEAADVANQAYILARRAMMISKEDWDESRKGLKGHEVKTVMRIVE